MKKTTYKLTRNGVNALEDELRELNEHRGEIIERVVTAREFGDLSENAEYSAAREAQHRSEARIAEIQEILANYELIASDGDDKVSLGDRVLLKSGGREDSFEIVGAVEADPMNAKISDESPLGKELIGKKVGDVAKISTPRGEKVYEIVKVN